MSHNKAGNLISAKNLRERYKDEHGMPISHDTWTRWLEPIRDIVPKNTKIYTPKQIQAIYGELGEP